MNNIQTGTNWKHTGPVGGGVIHRVTSSTEAEITTWSDPVEDAGIGGYTWIGAPDDFAKEFTQV